MEHIFTDLRTKHIWAWVCLVAAGVFLACLVFDRNLTPHLQGWLAVAAYLLLALFFAPSLLHAAYLDHRHLLTVCIWSFVLVVLAIVTVYFAFYRIAGANSAKYVQILSVVPVFVAIWAAGVGWLIHFRLTSKAHRTNSAFSMVMEMRKSGELMRKQELLARHFPPGKPVDQSYQRYFPTGTIQSMHERADWDASRIDPVELEKAEAIVALRYVLNYYEFMAAGLKAGDLDENLLLETVSGIVVSLHKRAELFIKYVQADAPAGAGQPLAYQCLGVMCRDWDKKLALRRAEHVASAN